MRTMPLGRPVEPEVNVMRAGWLGGTLVGGGESGSGCHFFVKGSQEPVWKGFGSWCLSRRSCAFGLPRNALGGIHSRQCFKNLAPFAGSTRMTVRPA